MKVNLDIIINQKTEKKGEKKKERKKDRLLLVTTERGKEKTAAN